MESIWFTNDSGDNFQLYMRALTPGTVTPEPSLVFTQTLNRNGDNIAQISRDTGFIRRLIHRALIKQCYTVTAKPSPMFTRGQ